MTDIDPKDSPRERLLAAALLLIAEQGPRGATTRRIAERAGVNEVTLFRTFGTKGALISAALARIAQSIAGATMQREEDALAQMATGDIEMTALILERLAQVYMSATMQNRAALARLLPELRGESALGKEASQHVRQAVGQVVAFFRHAQAQGHLTQEVEAESMVLTFMGPMLTSALLGDVVGVEMKMEPRAYVERFLLSHGV